MAPNNDLGPDLAQAGVNQAIQQLSGQLNSTVRSAMREMAQQMLEFSKNVHGATGEFSHQKQILESIAQSHDKIKKSQEAEIVGMAKILDLQQKIKDRETSTRFKSDESRKKAVSSLAKELQMEERKIALTKRQIDQEKSGIDALQRSARVAGGGAGNRTLGMRRNRNGAWETGMEVASDLNLPGVGAAATVGKYAGRGVNAMTGLAGEETTGMLAGGLGLAGLGVGALAGGAILAGGYTAMQGYKAYNLAHQMAPGARTALGQGSRNWRGSLGAYGGYGGAENLETLTSLNRSMGGQFGQKSMKGATDISNLFGIGREEAGSQAGALLYGGGAKSGTGAMEDLKKVMIEGVKGGMDRARITEFTQQVVGIQQRVFQMTGQNVTRDVSRDLGRLMGAGGGEKFLHGPGMAALGGFDQGVSAAGHLNLQGPMMGVMLRAFGNKKGGVEGLYDFMSKTEGGLFGMKGGPLGGMKKIFGELNRTTGGNEHIGNMLASKGLGLGVNQVQSLREISARAEKGGAVSKSDQKILDEMKKSTEDPMMQLLQVNKSTDATLAMLASSDKGLGAVIDIDKGIQTATELSVDFLKRIADKLAPEEQENKGGFGDVGKNDTLMDKLMTFLTGNLYQGSDTQQQGKRAIPDPAISDLTHALHENTHATKMNSRTSSRGKIGGT